MVPMNAHVRLSFCLFSASSKQPGVLTQMALQHKDCSRHVQPQEVVDIGASCMLLHWFGKAGCAQVKTLVFPMLSVHTLTFAMRWDNLVTQVTYGIWL